MTSQAPKPHKFVTKQPRKIIPEEDYQSTLAHIVTRDFYPALPGLRRDAAIIEARGRGDIAGAVAIRRAARKEEMAREREWEEDLKEDAESDIGMGDSLVRTADGTVVRGKTDNIDNYAKGIRKRPRLLQNETITGFHARVTSEDNAEFEINQDREQREREINLGIIYSARADKEGRLMIEACVNRNENEAVEKERKIASRALLGCDTPLGLASDLYNASPSAGLRLTDGNSKGKSTNELGRNGLFFQPQHHSTTTANRRKNETAPFMLATGAPSGSGTFLSIQSDNSPKVELKSYFEHEEKNGITDNLLMPPPPARSLQSKKNTENKLIDKPTNKNNQQDLSNYDLVEYLSKPTLPDINPPATRFPYQNESRLRPYSHTLGGGDARINSGGRNGFETDASDTTDLDASPRSLTLERAARNRARQRENETFVAMTPLIRRGGDSKYGSGSAMATEEPIMTRDDIASSSAILGNGMTDQRSKEDAAKEWEYYRPPDMSAIGNKNETSGPIYDVIDVNTRESLARKAEEKLIKRSKIYRAAGSDSIQRKNISGRPKSESIAKNAPKSSSTLDRKASLTPAARALLEATNNARNPKKPMSRQHSSTASCIFPPSPITSSSSHRLHAGSKDSFGSALRMSYTPKSTESRRGKRDGGEENKSSCSSSSLRRTAEAATPRFHQFK
mmetsp:Transcript_11651/g.24562  ORF Transcript_11651/g.24562 Transcript_11651/m.24562 type:complete len:679 (+) Transcript_11651:129-2165(+)